MRAITLTLTLPLIKACSSCGSEARPNPNPNPNPNQGVQLMRVGGKARLHVPSELGYGDRGVGPIPPGSVLVFELELVDIVTQ